MLFRIHPDGRILIQDDNNLDYADTVDNFVADYGTPFPKLEVFGTGFGALISNDRQIVTAGGNTQLPAEQELVDYALTAIGNLQSAVDAQTTRRAKEQSNRVAANEAAMTPQQKVARDLPSSQEQLDVIWDWLKDQDVLTGAALGMYNQMQAVKQQHGV